MGPHPLTSPTIALPGRYPDWQERLTTAIAHHQGCVFEWGAYDCGTLFASAVRAMTGHDPLGHLPPWFSERSALRALLAVGQRSVEQLVASQFVEITTEQARIGDLVFADVPSQPLASPAVVLGGEALSRNEQSLLMIPATMWRRAFRV